MKLCIFIPNIAINSNLKSQNAISQVCLIASKNINFKKTFTVNIWMRKI